MLKILIPTDFSANARNAVNFGIEMANRIGAQIMLYHVYPVPRKTGSLISVERYVKKDAEDDMQKLIGAIKPMLTEKVLLDGKITSGSAITGVCNKAKNGNYDLIVMGTQGASGLKEIVGSNASGIMNRTKVPLLAIPAQAKFQTLKKIVLAVDENPIEDAAGVNVLNKIRLAFDSNLNILHLATTMDDVGIDPSVNKLFSTSLRVTTKYETHGQVPEMIEDHVQSNQADLLCMIRRKRGILHELFNPSITKQEIFKSKIPILILHD